MTPTHDEQFRRLAARELELKDRSWVQRLPPRLPQEGHIAGVCAGLAAYLGRDVRLVRGLFVVVLLFGVGGALPIYLALWVLMPSAG